MDVEAASASIDALIDRRAAGRDEASATEMAWKESVRKHNARLRRERQSEWYCHLVGIADSLRKSAEHFERKAEQLLEDELPKGAR